MALFADQLLPVKLNAAAFHMDHSKDGFHQSGFARSVGAQKGDDFPFLDFQADAL